MQPFSGRKPHILLRDGRTQNKLAIWERLNKQKKGKKAYLMIGGQFDTGTNLTPGPIWHQECKRDNLTPVPIWHRSQFDTKSVKRTIWHQECERDNLTPVPIWHQECKKGQFDTGTNLTPVQFDTINVKRYNLAPWNELKQNILSKWTKPNISKSNRTISNNDRYLLGWVYLLLCNEIEMNWT